MSQCCSTWQNKWSLDSNFPVFLGAKKIINELSLLYFAYTSVFCTQKIQQSMTLNFLPKSPSVIYHQKKISYFYRALDKWPTSTFTVTIQILSQLLAYGNSCVNPILYAFLSEPFRRGFCAIVTCIRPAGPHGLQG